MGAKASIIRKYINFVKENARFPSLSELVQYGITKKDLKEQFGDLHNLHEEVKEKYNGKLANYVLSEEDVFTKVHLEQLSSDVQKYKRFIITTVVDAKKVNVNFYKSIQNYCKRNDAKLLLIPCADIFSKWKSTTNSWSFDPILRNENFIFKETKLNDNFFISSIKLSAKQIRPTTGLSRIGQRNCSFVFASPKQELEYVVTSTGKLS